METSAGRPSLMTYELMGRYAFFLCCLLSFQPGVWARFMVIEDLFCVVCIALGMVLASIMLIEDE